MQTKSHLSVLIHEQAKKYGKRRALIYHDFGEEKFKSISWIEFSQKVRQVSLALLNLGVKVQENVGIFSQNAVEYIYIDFGLFGIRAVSVPFYATSSEQQIHHMIDDAQIRILFVGEQEQYDKARRIFLHCNSLEKIIIFDKRVKISWDDTYSSYFDDFLALNKEDEKLESLQKLYQEANEDDLCNILYTSGTTGNSKGVMITYLQFHAALNINDEVIPITEKDRIVDFLPFTHILERGWIILCLSKGAEVVINTDPKDILKTMRQTHPTSMSAVPRFWEKLYVSVKDKIDRSSSLKQKMYKQALNIGHKYNVEYLGQGKCPPHWLSLKYETMDKTIFSYIRKSIGIISPNIFPTAGAAISPKVEDFVRSIGIWMISGYGLTESLATVSLNHKFEPFTIGSVGYPIKGLDIKIDENGEILLKGPTITKGYYKREDLNKEAFDEQGYFHTGDAGYFKDKELFLKDRIKDLFKTSNGKYIAPQMIESKLIVDKFIDHIAVIADNRKFVSALIIPQYEMLEEYAKNNNIEFSSREELCANERIYQMMQERIETLQQQFASFEKIKRFALLPNNVTLESGEITSTLKIRRKILEDHYKSVIEKIYEN